MYGNGFLGVQKWFGGTEMDQSSEEEVLVWVSPNHESKTSDLEKPILALPIHWIDIPEKLKKWHQEVENWHQFNLQMPILNLLMPLFLSLN